MINETFSYETLERVKRDPAGMHWSQSLREQVVKADILSQGKDFVLVKTDFLAPKLIKHATWRTDSIGETSRKVFEMYDNIKMYKDIVRWFYQIMLPESYINGEFPHEDYTLYLKNIKNDTFVNLRRFPEGSYLLDLIDAEVDIYDDMFNVVTAGAASSYSGGAEENDCKTPKQRTKTLNQLIKQNRIRQGRICIQSPGEDYEVKMRFKEFNKINSSRSNIMTDVIDKVNKADLSECALQEVLTCFKNLLDKCGVEYRM